MMEETINNALKNLIKEYPHYNNKIIKNNYSLKYSKRIKNYNGYIQKKGNDVIITLSHVWSDIDDDIKAGIIHMLISKILKLKIKTTDSIELYNSFIKNLPVATKKNKINEELKQYFDFLNNGYFLGLMETPNLIFKDLKDNRFGYYNYLNDTICINKSLSNHIELLKYVLYHEMLHKHLKFQSKGIRNFYHTKEFKELEQKYPNSKQYENELKNFSKIKQKRTKSFINKLLNI